MNLIAIFGRKKQRKGIINGICYERKFENQFRFFTTSQICHVKYFYFSDNYQKDMIKYNLKRTMFETLQSQRIHQISKLSSIYFETIKRYLI